MSALAEYLERVLVVGGENYQYREVAKQYGIKDIIVPTISSLLSQLFSL